MVLPTNPAPITVDPETPAEVVKAIYGIYRVDPPMPFEYDVLLMPEQNDDPDYPGEWAGVDFSAAGHRGQHFFLKEHEATSYRMNRSADLVRWSDLPEATKKAILAYIEWSNTL
jgi:hypothetical protein